uniref:Zinc finger protein 420 n=1 Tax=Phallusia mammillata TaxID=59560 RepID=A0A6F9DY82_9ASCI|nr:zinc finger protein 420 [Phallusia mammillata]
MDDNNNLGSEDSESPRLIVDFGMEELNKLLPSPNGAAKWISFNGKEYGQLSEMEMVEMLIKAEKLEKIPLLAKKYENEREKIKQNINEKKQTKVQMVDEEDDYEIPKTNKKSRKISSSEDDVEFVKETLADKKRTNNSPNKEVPSKKFKSPTQENFGSSITRKTQNVHYCPICCQLFTSILSVSRHVTKVHIRGRKCEVCGQVLSNPANLRRHQRNRHGYIFKENQSD